MNTHLIPPRGAVKGEEAGEGLGRRRGGDPRSGKRDLTAINQEFELRKQASLSADYPAAAGTG